MAEPATAGTSSQSPSRKPSPCQEDINALKKSLGAELRPLLEDNSKLKNKLSEQIDRVILLRRGLKKCSDQDEKKELQLQIDMKNGIKKDLQLLIEASDRSVAQVKAKYEPKICELELQVQLNKVKAQLPLEAAAKYDKISKRLKAIAELLEAKDTSKCLSSLCVNADLLEDCYQKSITAFEPIESPVPDSAFDFLCETLRRYLKIMPISFNDDGAAKRSFLSMPFFVCALDGLSAEFQLNFDVSVSDEHSKLDGKADIVVYCGKIEILVIEDLTAIPQALVEMDCLSKKRLSMNRHVDKEYSFGVVTDFCCWYFLKLNVDGTYFVSHRYDLSFNVFEENNLALISLIRNICMKIRGLVGEATA